MGAQARVSLPSPTFTGLPMKLRPLLCPEGHVAHLSPLDGPLPPQRSWSPSPTNWHLARHAPPSGSPWGAVSGSSTHQPAPGLVGPRGQHAGQRGRDRLSLSAQQPRLDAQYLPVHVTGPRPDPSLGPSAQLSPELGGFSLPAHRTWNPQEASAQALPILKMSRAGPHCAREGLGP